MTDINDIPTKFYKGSDQPKADTVGKLIKQLKRLPKELRLDEEVEISVCNVHSGNPVVLIEEAM